MVKTAIRVALGNEVTQVPSHAGRLRPLERCIFALVFVLMASFVVFVAFLANTARGHLLLTGPPVSERTVPYGLSQPKAGLGQLRQPSGTDDPRHSLRLRARLSAGPDMQLNDAELATALQPVISADPGRLAVGVVDLTTGDSATYNSGAQLRGGGVVTADILAVLLLQHQQAGTRLSAREAQLTMAMMYYGSGAATAELWTIIGGPSGLAAGNATLKLRHTTIGVTSASWRWTTTTVADQLQLLTDLTGPQSPLHQAAQAYALGLMMRDASPQRWDVLAAATPGAPCAAADGSLFGPRWVIGSIGLIQRKGHELLVAVLSDRNPVQGPAITTARAAALAAASLVS